MLKLDELFHGQKVRCIILGRTIEDAKISISPSGRIHICQNFSNGDSAHDKLDYKYSWLIYKKNHREYSPENENVSLLENAKAFGKKIKLKFLS